METNPKNTTYLAILSIIVGMFVIVGIVIVAGFAFLFLKNGVGIKELSEIKQLSTTEIITIHIDFLPSGIDKKYEQSVRDAILFWERNVNVDFKEVPSFEEAKIDVTWVKEFGGERLGHIVYGTFIEIGLGDSKCLERWRPYTYETVFRIAVHEIGHALGYEHDDNPRSVMYHGLKTKYKVDIEETGILPDGWKKFYPVCTRSSIAEYSFKVTSNVELDIYVVPSKDDYKLFRQGWTFRQLFACKASGTKSYKKTCSLPLEGGIILHNPTFLGLGLGEDAIYTIIAKEL